MKVSVTYALPGHQEWLNIEMPEGCSAAEAIEQSGILKEFPEINIETAKIGIFARVVKPEHILREGDRVEIYRPLLADPKEIKKRRGMKDK